MPPRPDECVVSQRVLLAILDSLEAAGLDPRPALEGTGLTLESVRRAFGRHVAWDLFIEVLERAFALAGSPARFEDAVGAGVRDIGPLRAPVGFFVDPLDFTRFSCYLAARLFYPGCWTYTFHRLSPTQARFECELRPGLRGSRAYWHGTIGVTRVHPVFFGGRPARIDATFDDRRGSFLVTIDPPRTLAARLQGKSARRFRDELSASLAQERGQHAGVHDVIEDVAAAAESWVLGRETFGAIDDALADAADPGELADVVRALLAAEPACRGAALVLARDDAPPAPAFQHGALDGRVRRRELVSSMNSMGSLLVAGDASHRLDFLVDELVPRLARRLSELRRVPDRPPEPDVDAALLAALLEAVPAPAWIDDGQGRVLVANAAATSAFATGLEPAGTADRLVTQAADGRRLVLSRDVRLLAAPRLEAAARRWRLTPRQLDVLARVAEGRSNKEIAHDLACTEAAVELHLTNLFRKTKAATRAEVVSRFWREADAG